MIGRCVSVCNQRSIQNCEIRHWEGMGDYQVRLSHKCQDECESDTTTYTLPAPIPANPRATNM